jgi:hypothetical protein
MIMMGDKKRTIHAILGPEEGDLSEKEEGGDNKEEKMAAMKELIDCVHAKDEEGAMSAFEALFECCDSLPHVEGPHLK